MSGPPLIYQRSSSIGFLWVHRMFRACCASHSMNTFKDRNISSLSSQRRRPGHTNGPTNTCSAYIILTHPHHNYNRISIIPARQPTSPGDCLARNLSHEKSFSGYVRLIGTSSYGNVQSQSQKRQIRRTSKSTN